MTNTRQPLPLLLQTSLFAILGAGSGFPTNLAFNPPKIKSLHKEDGRICMFYAGICWKSSDRSPLEFAKNKRVVVQEDDGSEKSFWHPRPVFTLCSRRFELLPPVERLHQNRRGAKIHRFPNILTLTPPPLRRNVGIILENPNHVY